MNSLGQRFMRTNFLKSPFIRSVGVLVGGTAFAQLIASLLLPIVTRLYSPADFSVYAVYAAVLAIISGVACLGFELAISLPDKDNEAFNLLLLAILCCLGISITSALTIAIMPRAALEGMKLTQIPFYGLMIPLGVFIVGSYGALQMWATRKKRFSTVARTRITQACVGGSVQIGFGYAYPTPVGLVVGLILNSGAGIVGLAKKLMKEDGALFSSASIQGLRRAALAYSRFPKYVTLTNLSNSASNQLPIVIIAALAIGPEAGFLMLAMRAAQAPMGLIGGAVGQVYLAHAPESLRAGDLHKYTASTIDGLVKTGVGPLLTLSLIAPNLFELIFGSEWSRAGELVRWMTPWFIMQFVSSPVSMVMHVVGRQRAMLLLTVLGLGLRVGILLVANYVDPGRLGEAYAISGALYYLICFSFFGAAAGISGSDCVRVLMKNFWILSLWVVAGLVLTPILRVFAKWI